jgi:hypothetical protein
MTRAEWKRCILSGLVHSLQSDLDVGAEWLFHGADGETVPVAEEKRMRAAVADLQAEFQRRGKGSVVPNVRSPEGGDDCGS